MMHVDNPSPPSPPTNIEWDIFFCSSDSCNHKLSVKQHTYILFQVAAWREQDGCTIYFRSKISGSFVIFKFETSRTQLILRETTHWKDKHSPSWYLNWHWSFVAFFFWCITAIMCREIAIYSFRNMHKITLIFLISKYQMLAWLYVQMYWLCRI